MTPPPRGSDNVVVGTVASQEEEEEEEQTAGRGISENNNNNNNNNNAPNNVNVNADTDVKVGPDLQASRTPLDTKLYRQIVLPNGLRCVLIQDTTAMHQLGPLPDGEECSSSDDDEEEEEDEEIMPTPSVADDGEEEDDDDDDGEGGLRDAAAALLVGAGSAYDPPTCQGLAHFLEHLLFMGSAAYPGENEYSQFVARHGGSENAWTEWESTVYTMNIPQPYLWGALDRLAGHFVSPLLAASAVDRELNAIESEFQLQQTSDASRLAQLWSATADPNHYAATFGWGNLQSLREIPNRLGVNALTELKTFFERYYYAGNMRLAVIGAYTLDQLQAKVNKIFAPIPALPRSVAELPLPIDATRLQDWDAPYTSPLQDRGSPFDQNRSLAKIYRIIPVKERHSLTITWSLPSQMHAWKAKPTEFLSHLLGHESEGSLFDYVRKQKWVTALHAGVGDDGLEQASSHWLFSLTLRLSELGLQQWRQVVDVVYQYLGLLRWYASSEQGWPKWIYEELKQMQSVSYRYSDEPSPDDTVETLAENMAPHCLLPAERLLDGHELLFAFDAAAVRDLLENYMVPRNARMDLQSSSFGKHDDATSSSQSQQQLEDARSNTIRETVIRDVRVLPEPETFDVASLPPPQVEIMFGTQFWCHAVPEELLNRWTEMAQPTQQPVLSLRLPPQNPFVPLRYDLKPLPDDDAHHPLLRCSLKVCISVGKRKQWFPTMPMKFDRKKNALLLAFEDEEEKWHTVDQTVAELAPEKIYPEYEGSLDNRKMKYRIVTIATRGGGGRAAMEEELDSNGEVNPNSFPPIPPALPPSRKPREICNSSVLRLWHLQDRNFHRPIAELRMQIICGGANASPLHLACADLLVELVSDASNSTAYLASVAELASALEASCQGFAMRFHGFDDKLLDLVQSCMQVFLSFRGRTGALPENVATSRFDVCLEVLRRKYRNSGMSSSSLAAGVRLRALRKTMWSSFSKMEAIKNLDVKTFIQTVSNLLKSFAIEALYHGNVDLADAKKAKDMILSVVEATDGSGLRRKHFPAQSVLRIPSSQDASRIIVPSKVSTDMNTAVEVYFQIGKDNLEERVMNDLLMHIMDEPFFDQLRTKESFGYSVHCDVRWTFGIMGCMFGVVSSVKSAADISARVDRFLREFRLELAEMSTSTFVDHLVGLATHKLDMFNSLSEETSSYWSEIVDGRYEWQVWRDEAIYLRSITKEQVIAAFDAWLNPDSGPRQKIEIHVIGGDGADPDAVVSLGRPVLDETVEFGSYVDKQIAAFHKTCKSQTWGRVNSKLF